MQLIKKKDVVIFQQEHIDPQSGESYYIEHKYSLREYSEIKESIKRELLEERLNANKNVLSDLPKTSCCEENGCEV